MLRQELRNHVVTFRFIYSHRRLKVQLFALIFAIGSYLIAGCSDVGSPDCLQSDSGLSAAAIDLSSLPDQQVVLSIDHAPFPNQKSVIEFLQVQQVQATFFVEGRQITESRELREISSGGQIVGNMGESGVPFQQASLPEPNIRSVDAAITPFVRGDVFLLRNPGGTLGRKLATYLNEKGLSKYIGHVGWTVGATPGKAGSPSLCEELSLDISQCVDEFWTRTSRDNKGVIRMDGQYPQILELVTGVVNQLKSNGFSFVPLNQVPTIQEAIALRGGSLQSSSSASGCTDY